LHGRAFSSKGWRLWAFPVIKLLGYTTIRNACATARDCVGTINRIFGRYISADVLAAPHHGARCGMHAGMLLSVSPNTVLISAGVDSSYGHPHSHAVEAYRRVAQHVFATNAGPEGTCLLTRRDGNDFKTHLVRHFDPVAATQQRSATCAWDLRFLVAGHAQPHSILVRFKA
jgi:hypothetical protein